MEGVSSKCIRRNDSTGIKDQVKRFSFSFSSALVFLSQAKFLPFSFVAPYKMKIVASLLLGTLSLTHASPAGQRRLEKVRLVGDRRRCLGILCSHDTGAISSKEYAGWISTSNPNYK